MSAMLPSSLNFALKKAKSKNTLSRSWNFGRRQVCHWSEVSYAAVTVIQRAPWRKGSRARRWESSVLRLGGCLHRLNKYFFCVVFSLASTQTGQPKEGWCEGLRSGFRVGLPLGWTAPRTGSSASFTHPAACTFALHYEPKLLIPGGQKGWIKLKQGSNSSKELRINITNYCIYYSCTSL